MRGILAHYLKSCIRLLPIALIIAFIFGIIGPGTALANPGWYSPAGWQYRKQITINAANVTANLSDFPVLISITSDAGLGTHAQPDGDDILFTAADETTKLSHEIEKYSSNGVTANLTAWVKIPSLSSNVLNPTVIYMYYGNSGVGSQQDVANVWDTNFKMVQHLSETSGTHYDSTQYNNDGAASITAPGTQNAVGKIDGADTFDGINDIIDFGSNASLYMTNNITIEIWVKRTDNATFERFLSNSLDSANYAYEFGVGTGLDTNKWRLKLNTDAKTFLVPMAGNPGDWLYVVATYDSSGTNNMKIYENGNLLGSDNYAAPLTNHGSLKTNRQGKLDGWCKSSLDEIRISNITRSADWIQTSYNNQNNPSSFFLPLGLEEYVFAAPTVTTDAASAVEETTATLNGTLNSDGGEACQFSFEWGTSSGSYTANISWAGSITTGQSFSANITGLNKGQPYYFRANVKNSAAVVNGSEVHFLTKPDGPEALNATANGTSQIDLSWAMGTGAGNTMVRGKLGSYPTSYTDGYEVYFGAGTNASDAGLSPGTTYFYRGWSEKTGSQQWSDTFSSASATTNAGPPTVIGGKVFSVNKAMVLAPWLGGALAFALITTYIVMYIRKKTPPRPPPGKNH